MGGHGVIIVNTKKDLIKIETVDNEVLLSIADLLKRIEKSIQITLKLSRWTRVIEQSCLCPVHMLLPIYHTHFNGGEGAV